MIREIKPSEIPSDALRMLASDGRPLALSIMSCQARRPGRLSWRGYPRRPMGYAGAIVRISTSHSGFALSLISPASDQRISSTLLGTGGSSANTPTLR